MICGCVQYVCQYAWVVGEEEGRAEYESDMFCKVTPLQLTPPPVTFTFLKNYVTLLSSGKVLCCGTLRIN